MRGRRRTVAYVPERRAPDLVVRSAGVGQSLTGTGRPAGRLGMEPC